ncbi:BCS1 N terminal-domain-containing protein [Rhypophila decipiens]|uniref:BCS1 N terminal-domain-containing protein n=1 Tax=Rhypophila decipiens TaxID=261697 RepID=A0AAN7B3Q0_9PEZI|nr:BCS1 N terminal-domain-containing protein [Rhypophila decipiens]
MDTSSMASSATGMLGADASSPTDKPQPPQMMLLDFFFPGFSVFSAAVQKYLHVDLSIYIPLVILLGAITFAWRYFSEQLWDVTESHLMSVVDIRTDDEIYNMLMAWVATQRFSQGARRFVVNTNLNSRSWFLWRYDYDDEEEDDGDQVQEGNATITKKDKKALAYTPTFGSHWFWYKGRLLIFRRSANRETNSYLTVSEREEISISCFGRNPWVLKELLHEARQTYMKRDEAKTLIYRGTSSRNSSEPTWQRCMARTSRPFSTVILNEKVKKDLIDDVTDYLNPATRRWYSNRGIPYRRGYLLYGPPGTGKSSLSLALAGFFKMRIYIVSLSSPAANEENLATLFAELPRRCVVLLEDIDSAGLTHTRDNNDNSSGGNDDAGDMVPGQITTGSSSGNNSSGRLSLSGLLNILDGVASQEGRVLIMTTNHLEKLDKALIRPGRVDMIVKFDRADQGMTAEIFKAIFAPLEGDDAPLSPTEDEKSIILDAQAEKEKAKKDAEDAKKKKETIERISNLAEQFAAKIPEREFSPAEIQGYLLKNKRNPEAAVEGAEQFIEDTRKERKEKEAKDEQEKKKQEAKEAEEKKKEAEEKKKKEEEEKAEKEKKEQEEKDNKKKKNHNKSKTDSDSSSSSDSDSDSESASEYERWRKRRKAKKAKKAAKKAEKKSKSKAAEKEVKSETIDQKVLATPPLTPKKDTFEATGFPELLFVNKTDAVPAIKVEECAPMVLGLKITEEGRDSGYGTPTASVKGDEESEAVVGAGLPAIKA